MCETWARLSFCTINPTHTMTTMLMFTVMFSPRYRLLVEEFGIEFALSEAAIDYVLKQAACVDVTLN